MSRQTDRAIGHGVGINRRTLLAAGATTVALGLSSPSAWSQEPVSGGILKLGFSADPAGFDPAKGPSGMSHVVIEQVYSTLMSLDPDAVPYPDLAESFEVSEDGLTYTFHLRQGVKFHNGDALTAEDVKFTFDRLRAKDSGYSYGSQVETIADVVVVDPQTVKFTLSSLTGPFLTYMAFPGSSIVPKKLVESGHDLNAQPIGSGPFKFVSYQPRSMVKFEKNADFYETGKPYFDAMEFHLIADVTALTNAVLSGTINFSNEIPPKDWARSRRRPASSVRRSKARASTGCCPTTRPRRWTIPRCGRPSRMRSTARRSSRALSLARRQPSPAASYPSGTGAMPA